MEINLSIVFALTGFGIALNVVFMLFLFKKVAMVEVTAENKIQSNTNDLKQELSKLREVLSEKNEQSQLNNKKQAVALLKKSQEQTADITGAIDFSSKAIIGMVNDLDNKLQTNQERSDTELKLIEIRLGQEISELIKQVNQAAFDEKHQQISHFEQLTKQLNTLRIENIVEMTNELGKHNELKVDSDDFIKHLGDCKVVKIEDKHTGQVTQVYYENGVKRSTDTFAGEELKYQMFYNEFGKAERGVELNNQGNIAFEYIYDDAGEVSKRVEYAYDELDNETDKQEVSY